MSTANSDNSLASMLTDYCQYKDFNRAQLAAYLDCQLQDLERLALYPKPNTESPTLFRQEVEQIASELNIAALNLARLIRAVEALRALQNISNPQAVYVHVTFKPEHTEP